MNTSKNKVEIVEDVVFLIIILFFCILGVFSLVLGFKYYSSKWTRISSARKILIIFSSIYIWVNSAYGCSEF